MIPLTLEQLADVVAGEVAAPEDGSRQVHNVTIDSRKATKGSLFVPLPGEHVDGHDFIRDANAKGAGGHLFEARRLGSRPLQPGAVVVDDPADALLGLGAWVRDEVDPLVVAITGSSGKTTTKDLTAAATAAGRRTVANLGSYNNELGVPLTACRLERDTEVLVTEIGSRGIGHIARLAPLVRPDIAVVTSVGAAHLELLGTVEVVARAKAELIDALDETGTAVLNADDPRVAAMAAGTPARVVTFGRREIADWRAVEVRLDDLARPQFKAVGPGGEAEVRLPLPGDHNVGNALAALAVADLAGVELPAAAAAVEKATVSRWRMELRRRDDGVVVLNDAYNANPVSTAAALRTIAAMAVSGRRWAVLGYMAELGPSSDDAHRELGRFASELAIDVVVVVGDRARQIVAGALEAGYTGRLETAKDPSEAIAILARGVQPGDAVLIKASRSVGLEAVATGLLGAPES